MSRRSQIAYLAVMDARRNSRSKGVLFIIFLLPLLVWGVQIGLIQLDAPEETSYEDTPLYIVNHDLSVSNVSLGDFFVQVFNQTIQSNTSILYGAQLVMIDIDLGQDIKQLVLEEEYSPLIYVPQNFTSLYLSHQNETSPPAVLMLYFLPTDANYQYDLQFVTDQIIKNYPFSVYTVDSFVGTRYTVALEEGEQVPDDTSAWMAAYFLLYVALIAPMPMVTSSFARENEQKTLESVMVMPMANFDILMGKFLGGAILLLAFALSNIVGLFVYDYILTLTDLYQKANVMQVQITPSNIIFFFLSIYLTTLVALALGISLTSRMDVVRTAETTYNMVLLIPFAIIALLILITNPGPTNPLFVLPWAHSIAIIFKGMFPNSLMTELITGNVILDILIHIMVLLLFVLLSLVIAATLDRRGKIFAIGD